MAKFRIKDTQNYMTSFYMVEAETAKEAEDLYCMKLAGSLPETEDSVYNPEVQDGIEVELVG